MTGIDIDRTAATRGSLRDAVRVASQALVHRRDQLSAVGRLPERDRASRSIDALQTAASEADGVLDDAIEEALGPLPDFAPEDEVNCDMAISAPSRARGHCAAAALAYQCGLTLRDARTGELHDHSSRTARGEIAATGIVSSRPTPIAADEQTLTDAVESAEQRRDSRLLRDIKIGIHNELDLAAQVRLAESFATAVAERFDTVAVWALHAPCDSCAHHCRVTIPTRSLSDDRQTLGPRASRDADAVAVLRALVGDVTHRVLTDG